MHSGQMKWKSNLLQEMTKTTHGEYQLFLKVTGYLQISSHLYLNLPETFYRKIYYKNLKPNTQNKKLTYSASPSTSGHFSFILYYLTNTSLPATLVPQSRHFQFLPSSPIFIKIYKFYFPNLYRDSVYSHIPCH